MLEMILSIAIKYILEKRHWHFIQRQMKLMNLSLVRTINFASKFSAQEPALKFFSGVSTYNLIPYEIGQYFNKIQCFCFEEQILNPGESVDMPVFFFIDPDVDEDPNCFNMEAVALNYTFHRVQSMDELPREDLKYFSFLSRFSGKNLDWLTRTVTVF